MTQKVRIKRKILLNERIALAVKNSAINNTPPRKTPNLKKSANPIREERRLDSGDTPSTVVRSYRRTASTSKFPD